MYSLRRIKVQTFLNKTKFLLSVSLLFLWVTSGNSSQPVNLVPDSDSDNVMVYASTIDSSGNTYITGLITGTTDFDPSGSTTNLSVVGTANSSVFIAKYDSDSALVWAHSLGGNINENDQYHIGRDIEVDSSGNVYVTGQFDGEIDVDPGAGTVSYTDIVMVGTGSTSDGNHDETSNFILKLDSSGNYLWSASINPYHTNYAFFLELDSQDNPILAGEVADHYTNSSPTITADTTNGQVTEVIRDLGGNASGSDRGVGSGAVAIKFDKDTGSITWHETAILYNSSSTVEDVTVDSAGNVWIVGKVHSGGIDFNDGNGFTSTSSSNDAYFFKVSSDGATATGHVFTKGEYSNISSVSSDASGNVYIAGYNYDSTIDLDPGAGTQNLTSSSDGGMVFVIKLDTDAVYQSHVELTDKTSEGYIYYPKINVHDDGSLLLYGKTADYNGQSVDLDTSGNTTTVAGDKLVIAKYDSSMTLEWAKAASTWAGSDNVGPNNIPFAGISFTSNDDLFVSMSIATTTDFDPGTGTSNVSGTTSGNYGVAFGLWSADGTGLTSVSSSDSDATLTASATVDESSMISIPTTANTSAEKVNIFDFTITDGGTADGASTDITQIVLNTSGTGDFSKVTWLLNGDDASDVNGSYSSSANTITFKDLSISVADGGGETYTVSGYFHNPTGLTDNATFGLSLDVDDGDITVDGSKTQFSSTQDAVSNSLNAKVDVTATKLIFKTMPSN